MKSTTKQRVKNAFEYALAIVIGLWGTHIILWILGFNAVELGIYPRTINGMLGIITSPFIHNDFKHLVANTLPTLVLTTLLFFFYKNKALLIYILIWVTAGILTWFIGRAVWHIGASSVVYGLASFLIFGGFFSRKFKLIAVSILVLIFYSGLVWGMLPTNEGISWEGHLSGAITGFIWAYTFRCELATV